MTLQEVKNRIWHHRRIHQNLVDLQVFADKAGVQLPITDVAQAELLLKSLSKKVKKKIETPAWCIQRYEQAHKDWFAGTYPNAFKDGFYPGMEPDWPDVGTAAGLTTLIINYATWKGCHANRINTVGRQVDGKWITGTTKKGTSDTALIINGRSVHLEVKAGKDTPKPDQLKQQKSVRSAGGVYEFIYDAEGFFIIFDRYYIQQTTLL